MRQLSAKFMSLINIQGSQLSLSSLFTFTPFWHIFYGSFHFWIPLKIHQSKINSCWGARPIGQTNHRPSVWYSKYYFFRLFIDLGHSKLFTFIFVFFKNRLKVFLQRILQEIVKKNNTWNIRRLVDDSFVPSAQRPSVNLS